MARRKYSRFPHVRAKQIEQEQQEQQEKEAATTISAKELIDQIQPPPSILDSLPFSDQDIPDPRHIGEYTRIERDPLEGRVSDEYMRLVRHMDPVRDHFETREDRLRFYDERIEEYFNRTPPAVQTSDRATHLCASDNDHEENIRYCRMESYMGGYLSRRNIKRGHYSDTSCNDSSFLEYMRETLLRTAPMWMPVTLLGTLFVLGFVFGYF